MIGAKVLMALGLAATTLTGAAAATGALPGPAQGAVATVVNALSPFDIPTGDDGASVVAGVDLGGGQSPESGAHVDATAPGGSASVAGGGPGSTATAAGGPGGGGSAGATANLTGPTLSSLPLPDVPGIPGVTDILDNLPVDVPDCASSIIDPNTGNLLVAPGQLAAEVLECVRSMVPAGAIPASVSQCLTSILGSLQGVLGGGVPSGVPSIDIASCVPVDVSPCVSSIVSSFGTNPMAIVRKLGSFSNLANLLNTGALDGCVPVSASECVASILDAFRSGTVGGGVRLDLSACLPTS